MKHRWLLGNPENWIKDQIITTNLKHFTNMDSNNTWEKYKTETDWIISLTTKSDCLKKKLKATQSVALATSVDQGRKEASSLCGKKEPCTVKA